MFHYLVVKDVEYVLLGKGVGLSDVVPIVRPLIG